MTERIFKLIGIGTCFVLLLACGKNDNSETRYSADTIFSVWAKPLGDLALLTSYGELSFIDSKRTNFRGFEFGQYTIEIPTRTGAYRRIEIEIEGEDQDGLVSYRRYDSIESPTVDVIRYYSFHIINGSLRWCEYASENNQQRRAGPTSCQTVAPDLTLIFERGYPFEIPPTDPFDPHDGICSPEEDAAYLC